MLLRTKAFLVCAAMGAVAVTSSCKREERAFRVEPPDVDAIYNIPATDFHAGGPSTRPSPPNGYEENAFAMSQGQTLFGGFNCSGCHFHGGGGIGPPLMDDKWIYGSEPEQIFATIMQGRPNGMPSFGGKLSPDQAWQIAAYVRSLSGLASANASPGRDDHMKSTQPPNSTDRQKYETPLTKPSEEK